jgi:hypothetical protein
MRSRLIVAVALMAVLAVAAPAAADGDGDGATRDLRTYQVTLTNKTTSQPISPPVVVTHDRNIRFWEKGAAASAGIIAIAEDGNPDVAVGDLTGLPGVTAVEAAKGPLTPKGTTVGDFTDTVTVKIQARRGDRLSLAGMLICTNDGFTGVDSIRLPHNNRTRVTYAGAYDAGSEINTERSGDIPDPCSALGPVGLVGDPNGNINDGIDANGVISAHRGIVGESDLLAAHNWRHRVLQVKVKMVNG